MVVIIGLCLVPCLYAWFNIFSNWDPYGTSATSNIHIAVASEDEGRDILGVKLNIGDHGDRRPALERPDGLAIPRHA